MTEPFTVPADGADVYRNFVLKLEIPKGKYLKALEYRPSNRRVVHHALFASDSTGKSRKEDEADPLPGSAGSLNIPGRLFPGSMSAWAPGREARPLPDGYFDALEQQARPDLATAFASEREARGGAVEHWLLPDR